MGKRADTGASSDQGAPAGYLSAADIQPGDIIHADWRSAADRAAAAAAAPAPRRRLRLLTWNIERGYELPAILEHLKAVDADILAIQEVDIGNDRSRRDDCFAAIGAALGLNGLFQCEFAELRSPLRDARSQGGGVHGNAGAPGRPGLHSKPA